MSTKRTFCGTAAAIAVLAVMLCGCGSTSSTTQTTEPAANTAAETEEPAATTADAPQTDKVMTLGESKILNFEPPQQGEEIVVINVKDFGTIKIKLFPDAAPEAVENFKGLIGMNYYDELIFHRVIPNFMIQGGDPRGNGTGGNSMWGGSFDGGVPEGLYHFTGAVAYANSGSTATNGSQFYIVNTPDGYFGDTSPEQLMEEYPDRFYWSQNVIDMYHEKGGTPFLDGGYTVFGQVIEGMDVVRAIAEVETDPNDKPLHHVTMETVRLEPYNG